MNRSPLHTLYDKIVCISLREREDKYKLMSDRLINHGIEVEWYHPVINGFNRAIVESLSQTKRGHFNLDNPNEFGCAMSHYHVIKTALLEGVQNLFVFEDDAVFHKDFDELLPKYLDKIPENTDGILLYSFMYDILSQNVRLNSRWTKAHKSWSLIAYGISRKVMEEYIKRQDAFFTISDIVTYKMQEEGFNFVVASPPLVVPNKELTSNIRTVKNYETTKSILLLGINENNYV